jgi:hypothetical protein
MSVIGSVLIAVGIVCVALLAAQEWRAARREAGVRAMLALLVPAQIAARRDARELLVWFPVAEASRRLMPDVFRELDAAMGSRFPFTQSDVDEAHARWTADWLAWERSHDVEYKLKLATLETEAGARGEGQSAITRARLDAVEQEQLARYQQRYEEYVRVAKALAALKPAGRT